jgi:hypothetical protein
MIRARIRPRLKRLYAQLARELREELGRKCLPAGWPRKLRRLVVRAWAREYPWQGLYAEAALAPWRERGCSIADAVKRAEARSRSMAG